MIPVTFGVPIVPGRCLLTSGKFTICLNPSGNYNKTPKLGLAYKQQVHFSQLWRLGSRGSFQQIQHLTVAGLTAVRSRSEASSRYFLQWEGRTVNSAPLVLTPQQRYHLLTPSPWRLGFQPVDLGTQYCNVV